MSDFIEAHCIEKLNAPILHISRLKTKKVVLLTTTLLFSAVLTACGGGGSEIAGEIDPVSRSVGNNQNSDGESSTKLKIKEAKWDMDKSRLKVKGEADKKTIVTLSNASSKYVLGT